MLVNPGLREPPATSTSLYAVLRSSPGETPRRHGRGDAFRFVLEGSGAFTTGERERVHMPR